MTLQCRFRLLLTQGGVIVSLFAPPGGGLVFKAVREKTGIRTPYPSDLPSSTSDDTVGFFFHPRTIYTNTEYVYIPGLNVRLTVCGRISVILTVQVVSHFPQYGSVTLVS